MYGSGRAVAGALLCKGRESGIFLRSTFFSGNGGAKFRKNLQKDVRISPESTPGLSGTGLLAKQTLHVGHDDMELEAADAHVDFLRTL